jgi:hypothetical protein
MNVDELKDDVREGRIDPDRLVEMLVTLQRELQAAQRRIEELEQQLRGSPPTRLDEPFSLRSEEQRQEKRGKTGRKQKPPLRQGRLKTADKIAMAVRTEAVYPEGVPEDSCRRSHTRVVWRLENGQAVLVAYDVYQGPGHRYGRVPGVLGRSEFGLEIMLAIAYQVFVVGLSFDKVCLLMNFFQNLSLKKSGSPPFSLKMLTDAQVVVVC